MKTVRILRSELPINLLISGADYLINQRPDPAETMGKKL